MRNLTCALISYLVLGCLGCSDDDVDSDEEARRAYLGLDKSIEKSLALGLTGFNLSTNGANIDPQTMPGDAGGTLTVSGMVDQGQSDNKGLRLWIFMVDYTDGPIEINDDHDTIAITYDTGATQDTQPYLNLVLRNTPDGDFTGTLNSGAQLMGKYLLDGAIEGELELNLTLSGDLMSGGAGTARVPGTTHVTGTAISGEGTYDVDLTI